MRTISYPSYFPNVGREQHRAGLTNAQMAKYLGITPTTYGRRKRNGTFRLGDAAIMCYLFRCDCEYLFEEKHKKREATKETNVILTEKEMALLQIYRHLNETGQGCVRGYAEGLFWMQQKTNL